MQRMDLPDEGDHNELDKALNGVEGTIKIY
jgi:hypothetical protein